MDLKLENNEMLIIEAQAEEVKVTTDRNGKILLDGNTDYKKIDDITFEKALADLKKKFNDVKNQGSWGKERSEEAINFIKEIMEVYHNYFRLDKTVLLEAFERKRGYSYPNYYQASNFPDFKTIDDLKGKISMLYTEIHDLKHKRDDELLSLQKELTKTKKLMIDKKEVETCLDFSMDIYVNCPFCDEWQSVDIVDYEGENEYETNHECEKCGKIFSVKATH